MREKESSDVIILTPWDSQGNQITDADGVCHTLRGCGGAGYQQGYIFAHWTDSITDKELQHNA